MVLTALLLLHLAGAEGPAEVETRGEAPPVQQVSVEQREAVRFRGGIHFAVTGAFSGYAPGGGPGLSAEAGATFGDRYSLSVRATVGTIVLVSNFLAGVSFDVALGERFSLGLAPSIALVGGVFVVDLPGSIAMMLPFRLSFAPFGRERNEVARRGLVLFVDAGPGYGLVMGTGFFPGVRPRPSPLSFTAALGVGYAVW